MQFQISLERGGTEGFEIVCLKEAWCTRGRWQGGEGRPGADAVAISP